MHSKNIRLRFIGIIHTPFKTPAQDRGAKGTIEVFKQYQKALKDIGGFSHLHLFYWLHRTHRYKLITQTPWDGTTHGLFATRSPHRINPIGYAVVELLKVHGRKLIVRGIDALDNTPVIDIKPFITSIDTITTGHEDWRYCNARVPKHTTYVLHMTLPRTTTMHIGKMGRICFKRGHYYYVGSAKTNLQQRIARHRQKQKKRFWHIDYLLAHAAIQGVYTSHLDEEYLARIMELLSHIPVKKFGASDSSRGAHLFFSPTTIVQAILSYTTLRRV